MTENTMRSIPSINTVDGFNPAEFTRELMNDDGSMSLYLDVKYRMLWFRLHRPNGKIDTEIVHVDEKSAVVCCKLYSDRGDPAEQYLAKSCAQRFISQEKYGERYLEIAETAAIGRVLAAAGYGTQFCGSADMLGGIIADAPIDMTTMEAAATAPVEASSRVLHQVSPAPQVSEEKPVTENKREMTTLEDYLNGMTLDDAKNVVVDVGRYSGTKLGEIVMSNPKDLDWYVKYYAGKNLALKAGAILLMEAATAKAS